MSLKADLMDLARVSSLETAGVVHDLGNLIQIASSAIAIIARSHDMPADRAPLLARAKSSLDHAAALVRQTVGGARDHLIAPQHISVSRCLADVATLVEDMCENLSLDLVVEAGLPAVRCDAIGLQNAILNLVLNARDAMVGTGIVTLRAQSASPGFVELSVSDSGIGMTPATIARAFTPFFTTRSNGLGGIGLPMVDRFVRKAGGEIAIDSEPHRGTTVTLRLPIAEPPASSELLVLENHERSDASAAVSKGYAPMKLYYAPGACSLSCRIALHEAGLDADFERVDLETKVTERGDDFGTLNPKGYVPMLVLDDRARVTENAAVLALLASRAPQLAPGGPLAEARLIEMLSYLATELHMAFKPLQSRLASEAEKDRARQAVARHLDIATDHVRELYLFGPRFTVADGYLFVMLRWAKAFGVPLTPGLVAYFGRVAERPAVRRALAEEGLS